MRLVLLVLTVLMGAQAWAAKDFECRTSTGIKGYGDKGLIYEIRFSVEGLDEGQPELVQLGWHEEYEMDLYFDYHPNVDRSPLFTLNIEPYVRMETTSDGKEILKITADDIGMNYATLVLYKNSGFYKGYLLTRMYGEEAEYTVLTCP